jgi:Na+-driven multidrug efflux pump
MATNDRTADLLKPTLTAGVIFGAIGSIPFLNLINCACCALIIGCGVLASRLYANESRRQGTGFRPAQGATVGLVSGAFYALTATIVGTIFQMVIGDPGSKMLLEWLSQLPSMPEENRQMIEEALQQASERSPSVFGVLFQFLWWVLLGAIFATLGGLIGGALFKVEPRPPEEMAGLPGPPPQQT